MKTISMDFETYKSDLRSAKAQGFEIVKDLKPRLITLQKLMCGVLVKRDDYDRAREQLFSLLKSLENVDE